MRVRIKYTKLGHLKFIGHLDVMRYFQKAVKRADLDIVYSNGYSPHQIMSFAAPLALGVTSEGEYFDAEFHSLISSAEFVKRFNEQMVEGVAVKDVVLLPEGAKNAMSVAAASDYRIAIPENTADAKERKKRLLEAVPYLLEKEKIEVLKKTKKNEKIEDIKKGIYKIFVEEDEIYMLLATGSDYNLKPELVVQALCGENGICYNRFDYQIHRIETYMKNKEGNLVSLLESGKRIL